MRAQGAVRGLGALGLSFMSRPTAAAAAAAAAALEFRKMAAGFRKGLRFSGSGVLS